MKKVFNIYVRVFTFLIPIFFLPILNDGFGLGKNSLWLLSGAVGLLLWVAARILEKKESMKVSGVMGLVILGLIWSVISYWRLSLGGRMTSLMYPVGLGTVLASVIWLFLWTQSGSEEERKKQFLWLTASGIVVAVTSLVPFLIPDGKLPINWPSENPVISISQGWSLTGSLIAEIILLAFLATNWVKRVVDKIKEGGYITQAMVAGGLVLGLGISIFKIIKTGFVVLDYTSSWIIAAEVFKRSAIFGVGLGNFSQAFNLFRPESYNLTKYWSVGFGGSGMGILQIWTELGIVGLGLVVLLAWKLLKRLRGFELIKTAGLLALVFFMPLNLISVFIITWVLVGAFERKKMGLVLKVGERGYNAAPILLGVLIVALMGWSGWVYGRILAADVIMRGSFIKAAKNDGAGTYNDQVKAIGMNANMADYRRVYSQTNLALAQNILANKEVSDADKEKASTLIQQSVREAKAAISLDNLNASYWSNLAVIYRNLIGVVDGAADWSAQGYQQAIILDPVNSGLKLDFGGLLFAAQNYESADRIFEEAVRVKQDYANAWYNWAYTAKNLNKIGEAVSRLTQAVALVPQDSGDYEKANKELGEWNKELEEAIKKQEALLKEQEAQQVKQAETLKTAEPLPTVGQEERVDVPATDLQPPVAPVIPSETPQAPTQ